MSRKDMVWCSIILGCIKIRMGIFLYLSLVLVLNGVTTRIVERQFTFPQLQHDGGWMFITKMGLRTGTTNIKITTQSIAGNAKTHYGQVLINLIPNHKWQSEQDQKCSRPIQPPIMKHGISMEGHISITDHTIQIEEQQLYYLVLKDCDRAFIKDYDNEQVTVKISFHIINSGSHLGEEDDHWLILPLAIGVGLWLLLFDKEFILNQSQQDPDYAKMILFGAIATNISSLMWRSFGYLIYKFLGLNYLLFHLIYLFMHSISQSMVLVMLALISTGWSLNFLQSPTLNMLIPLLSVFALCNIVMGLLTQLNNSSHDMHHSYDAPAGNFLIGFRILVSIAFLISVAITRSSSRYQVRQFLQIFGVLGCLYIFSLPAVVLVGNRYIPASMRGEFVFVSVQVIKSCCNGALMYMVSSSRSSYSKLCYRNASFLESGTGLF